MKAEEILREYADAPISRHKGVRRMMQYDIISAMRKYAEIYCYPKEFVEWLSFGSHPFVYWFDEKGQYYTDEITDKRWDIEDLYNHWKENEK